jgi:hypothetical protein
MSFRNLPFREDIFLPEWEKRIKNKAFPRSSASGELKKRKNIIKKQKTRLRSCLLLFQGFDLVEGSPESFAFGGKMTILLESFTRATDSSCKTL